MKKYEVYYIEDDVDIAHTVKEYLEHRDFYVSVFSTLAAAPAVPMLLFAALVFLFVGMAYYIGGRGLLRSNLSEILRDDVMV